MDTNREIEHLIERGRDHAIAERFEEANEAFRRALELGSTDSTALYGRAFCLRKLGDYEQAQTVLHGAMLLYPGDARLVKERGLLYFNQEQYREADSYFEQLLEAEHEHDNEDILALRASSLRLQRRYEEAERAVEKAMRQLPKSNRLLEERGRLHYDRERYEEAAVDFGQVLDANPDNESALTFQAICMRLLGRFEDAEEVLDRLPDSIFVLSERGLLHYEMERYDEAVRTFETVLARDENNQTALRWRITSLRLAQRFEEAEAAIEAALNRLPDVIVLNERGALGYDQKRYDDAVESFEQVLDMDRDNEYALRLRAESLRFNQRFAEAENAIEEALERLPRSTDLLNERGFLHYDQRQYAEAAEVFGRVLDKDVNNTHALRWRAASLRLQNRPEEAEEAIRTALGVMPDDSFCLNERGFLYYDNRRYDDAVETFERVLDTDEDNETALRWKAAALRSQRRFEEAEDVIEGARERLPESVDLLNEHGLLHLDREQFREAEACFAEAVERDSSLLQSRLNLAEALRRMNHDHEAFGIFQEGDRLFPDNPEVREQLGWFHIGRNDLTSAAREFQWLLDNNEEDIAGMIGLGATFFFKGSYEDAEQRFRQVLDHLPNDPVCHTNLAWALVKPEEHPSLDEAEGLCREALRLDEKNSQAFGCLGMISFKRGDFREAEDHWLASIATNQRDGNHADLGALYVKMGRYEEAKERLEKAIDVNRNDTHARIELGKLYLDNEETKEAMREFRQAEALDPNVEDPPLALGDALMRSDKLDEAEWVLRRAIRRLDENRRWRLHLKLSQLLTTLGDGDDDGQLFYEDALEEVQKAVRLKRDQPDPYFHAGIVRFKLGSYDKALKNFRACLDRDEDHFEADRNLRRVEAQLKQLSGEVQRVSFWGSLGVGLSSVILLIVLWLTYFMGIKTTETMLMTMTPILLGLVVVAILLPGGIAWLKLPGLDVGMVQSQQTISPGPPGQVGFGGSLPASASGTSTGAGLGGPPSTSSSAGANLAGSPPPSNL
jgi:tetratricopeptide (TPR) repeat protein